MHIEFSSSPRACLGVEWALRLVYNTGALRAVVDSLVAEMSEGRLR